jgi:putative acetyltransferase
VGSKLEVRRAAEQDAQAVAEVLRQAFAEFESLYTAPAFAATTPGATLVLDRMREGPLWVAVHGDRIIGTIAAVNQSRGCYIRGMGVAPDSRAHAAGRRLLTAVESFAAEARARRMFLSTTPFLDRAIRLYERFGFRRTAEGPHELRGTPLFTMTKDLG